MTAAACERHLGATGESWVSGGSQSGRTTPGGARHVPLSEVLSLPDDPYPPYVLCIVKLDYLHGGNVNLASTRKYNCDDIIKNYIGIYKVLVLQYERGDPPLLFQI